MPSNAPLSVATQTSGAGSPMAIPAGTAAQSPTTPMATTLQDGVHAQNTATWITTSSPTLPFTSATGSCPTTVPGISPHPAT